MVLLLLSFTGYCLLLKFKLHRDISHTPLIVSSCIILLMYIAGFCGLLQFMPIVLLPVGVLAFLYICISERTRLQQLIAIVCHPAIISFLVLSIIAWFLYHHRIYVLWDEFSHWGLLLKEMHLRHTFITKNFFDLIYDYPPGTALFQLFVGSCCGYSEGVAYFAQSLLIISALICLTGSFTRANIYAAFAILLITILLLVKFLLPLDTLYVDDVLAVFVGACLTMHINDSERSPASIWSLLPVLCVLPLIKPSGLLFATIIALVVFTEQFVLILRNQRVTAKQFPLNENKVSVGGTSKSMQSNILRVILIVSLFSAPMLASNSWKLYIANQHIPQIYATKFSTKDVFRLFTSSATTRERETRKLFFDKLLHDGLNNNAQFSYPITCPLFLSGIFLLQIITLACCFKWSLLLETIRLNILLLFGLLLFLLGILLFSLYYFSEEERLSIASLARYLNTYLFAWGMVAVAIFLRMLANVQWRHIIYACCAVMLGCLLLWKPSLAAILCDSPRSYSSALRLSMNPIVKFAKDRLTPGSKIYLAIQGDDGLRYLMLRYEFLPHVTNINGWNFVGTPTAAKTFRTIYYTEDEFERVLYHERYDYLYIIQADNVLFNLFPRLFRDVPHTQTQLYSLKRLQGHVILVPVK